MEEIEFFVFAVVLIIVSIVEIVFPILFIYLIVRTITQSIKCNSNQKYFKNNIVSYNDSNLSNSKYKNNYIDVSKNKLAKFNTDDINLLKDYFYDIFYRFEVYYNNLDYNMMKMLSTK